ncbi:TPA: response regulator [Vibrio vulnificus]|uniref:ATP-binding SpoIIE family protein phosphatase n=1 Tax=Vibrio vulnificus TaxID=672 RepID=UPI001A27E93D|nr:fused response regulator/phosphatase [Vibrio vulnificus]EJU9785479.1 fused response regulator/phosphatase [Vibrio vulnificus]MCA3988840.1 fused response regulator/phosphatase [Vibrio vulnificus]HAS8251074.1 response regulator [Vibrio vulnificus]
MKIYIVDDHPSNIEVCKMMLSDLDARISTFNSGLNVISALQEVNELPDVIVLDVMMPELDGFQTAQIIREAFPNRHIAIIFLTALDDQESFGKCLTFGDDFIPKPVQRNVLLAKVQAHVRIAKMYNEVAKQRSELSHFHEQVRYDYTIAESIFANLKQEMEGCLDVVSGVDYFSSPSTVFNGDLIILARRPHGGIYAMIADATGHGLPAAISAIPATRAFNSMAAKGMALGEIVSEINSALVRFLPMGMMLAASLFEISGNGRHIRWWGGGLPDAFLLNHDGSVAERLTSTHMPLGVLEEREFDASVISFELLEGQSIITYTDGVTESPNEEGEQFGEMRLLRVIEQHPYDIIKALQKAVAAFSCRQRHDDLSILTLKCPIVSASPESEQTRCDSQLLSQLTLKSCLTLNKPQIASHHLLPDLRAILKGVVSGGPHLDLICSVLSELLANAIDHGLLELDSKLKEDADGFFVYYQAREEKLEQLSQDAYLSIQFDYQPERTLLAIIIEHNGVGFDYSNPVQQVQESQLHGRGRILLNELCESVVYSNGGKCVTAIYQL